MDGKRAVTVTAQVEEDRANTAEVTADLQRKLEDLGERFRGVTHTFEGEQKETRESLGSLQLGFPAALFLIYAILAIQFRSYFQPVLVMFVIPFGVVGAVLGHLAMGYPVTMLSLIGVVALSGIVVNDSLILVDLVNRLRAEVASRSRTAE